MELNVNVYKSMKNICSKHNFWYNYHNNYEYQWKNIINLSLLNCFFLSALYFFIRRIRNDNWAVSQRLIYWIKCLQIVRIIVKPPTMLQLRLNFDLISLLNLYRYLFKWLHLHFHILTLLLHFILWAKPQLIRG